jgi:hypothetical protein
MPRASLNSVFAQLASSISIVCLRYFLPATFVVLMNCRFAACRVNDEYAGMPRTEGVETVMAQQLLSLTHFSSSSSSCHASGGKA